jgi:double-stranded uracil-DNA glycosylase
VSLRAQAFGPAIDARARVLVLGSLPGAESLRRGEYYAHRQNAFWRLMGAVVGVDLAALPYPARLEALAAARVGLWDVFASAVRPGSGDAAIRDAVHADLAGLVAGLPELRAIGFNGATAAKAGRRQLRPAPGGPALIDLPSSSPAHAGMPYREKLARWSALARYLG